MKTQDLEVVYRKRNWSALLLIDALDSFRIRLEEKLAKSKESAKQLSRRLAALKKQLKKEASTVEFLKESGGSISKFNELKWRIARKEADPCKCPICDTHLVRYPKGLKGSACKALILLVRYREEHGDEYAHVTKLEQFKPYIRAAQYGELVHWGLVEGKPNLDDPSIKDSGQWRATEKGAKFVYRQIRLPNKAWTFLNQFMDYDDSVEIGIEDTFEEKFHYGELMEEAFGPYRRPEEGWCPYGGKE